ncbi:Site-specific DNA recombinase [Petrocella atlantisensis]|uniref:Site-specific DNA recombinase n=1 Tax=Petrocella atlantisensis TaxID=2173034 RepID=A0A3P7PT80_9FIRM|nr:recombinase family protein [Petrocella atlantisensis]VDN47247.1 Site-specific DNA recombinase [Petrocella atlantisensis]
MSNIQIIEADKKRARRYSSVLNDNKRVAAYCRVSTDSEEQQSSYHSQVLHYKEMIKSKPDWELADIYADEGISGTGTKNRIEFQRMINDAMTGKIDMIITKSISRFARNTLDTLNYVRTLKEKNVAVVFEKENINTLTMNGEMLLVILSSLAQQESESISANVTMGFKMKMKRGELIGYNGCLGYDYNKEDKTIKVNEKEAEIVRYIFRRYIEGAGGKVIANELGNLGYKTQKGLSRWRDSTILGILKNEKYKGDLLLGKTFTTDPISHKRLKNLGERDQFYVSNNHEPIITDEMFERAKEIRQKRSRVHGSKTINERFSRKYPFSSICTCAYCGSILMRRQWNSGTKHEKYTWQCMNSIKNGRKACSHSKAIAETDLEDAFVQGYNMLTDLNKEVITEFVTNIEQALDIPSLKEEYEKLSDQIAKIEDKIQKLIDLRLEDNIDLESYTKKHAKFMKEQEGLVEQKRTIKYTLDSEESISMRIRNFKHAFNKNETLEGFDRLILDAIIEKVVVGAVDNKGKAMPKVLTFVLKSGLEVDDDVLSSLRVNLDGIEEVKVVLDGEAETDLFGDSLDRKEPLVLLGFKYYTKYFTFNKRDDDFVEKKMKDYINVRFAI